VAYDCSVGAAQRPTLNDPNFKYLFGSDTTPLGTAHRLCSKSECEGMYFPRNHQILTLNLC